ncbi:aldo/keto reductase [Amycolatopsis sp. WAC 01375]|uniref:aldo/keto reductase n=1 Tax=unclassified Amycolatopsis TaxID=2618356 RepID=UPI000F7916CF|nr:MULTISPECIES: aldo/keto reductase [unclassified Amycolatopsis]RSM71265.1 aldo/keto reductase [Amycolatopsis sp. WAC 01375]RSN36047.1 aldo/keto reductase [Amycolatopsis sp. WAC 01416]
MRYRSIGDVEVSAIGLGAMPLSIEGRPDRDRAIATIHAALDAGVTLIDTADSYHWHAGETGHNEVLIAEALAAHSGSDAVLVATKGGRGRPGDGSWTVTGTPAHLKNACEGSLKRLGVDTIGLYQLHKPDENVPWAESVGAIKELADEGKIRLAGLSNVSSAQILEAREILGGTLVSVQNEHAPAQLSHEPELALCTELGLAYLPWGPLRGIGGEFLSVAEELGVSPQQVCLAWLLAKSPSMIAIPGSTRPATIRDSAAAADLVLTAEDLARLP